MRGVIMGSIDAIDSELYCALHKLNLRDDLNKVWEKIKSNQNVLREAIEVTKDKFKQRDVVKAIVISHFILVDYDSIDKEVYNKLINEIYSNVDIARLVAVGALNGGYVDTSINTDIYWEEMIRYYSNIVGKYGVAVQRALTKLQSLPIDYICSTHGPVWRENISKVVSIYDRLSKYETEDGVVIVYGTMYGHTEQVAEAIAAELSNRGVKNIVMHNVSKSNPSYILKDIFKYRGLIVGSPTYSLTLYPEIEAILSKISVREVKNRIFGYFGSFTWASVAVKKLKEFADNSGFEVLENSVEMKQSPTESVYSKCRELASEMADKLLQ